MAKTHVGAYWHNRDKKWQARIKRSGKTTSLGYFHTEAEAGAAYQAALKTITPIFIPLTISKLGAAVIHLRCGRNTLVSVEDWTNTNKLSWRTSTSGYAYHKNNDNSQLWMHRNLLNPSQHQDVDHINGNKLDNRRCNLRLASRHQNNGNQRRIRRNKRSGRFKGVRWNATIHKWTAYIVNDKRQRHLGCFQSEIDAAKAYDAAAVKQWGEFAATNESLGRFNGGYETVLVE